MKTDASNGIISVGEGRPQMNRRSYINTFSQLRPGMFVQAASVDDVNRVTSSLNWYIKRNKLPWRTTLRTRELRVYVIEAKES